MSMRFDRFSRFCSAFFLVGLFSTIVSSSYGSNYQAEIKIQGSAPVYPNVIGFGNLPAYAYLQGSSDIFKLSDLLISSSFSSSNLGFVYPSNNASSYISFQNPFKGIGNGQTDSPIQEALKKYRVNQLGGASNLLIWSFQNTGRDCDIKLGVVSWSLAGAGECDILFCFRATLYVCVYDVSSISNNHVAFSFLDSASNSLEVNEITSNRSYNVPGHNGSFTFGNVTRNDQISVNVYLIGRVSLDGDVSTGTVSSVSYVGSQVGFPHEIGQEYARPQRVYSVNFDGSNNQNTFLEYARLFWYAFNSATNYCYGLAGNVTDTTSDYYNAVLGYSTFDKDSGGEIDASEFVNMRDRFDPSDDNGAGYTPYPIVELGPETITKWEEGPEYNPELDPGAADPDYPIDEDVPEVEMEDVPFADNAKKQRVESEVDAVFNDLGPMRGLLSLITQGSALPTSSQAPSFNLPLFVSITHGRNGWTSTNLDAHGLSIDFSNITTDSNYSNVFRFVRLVVVLLLYIGVLIFVIIDVVKLIKD